MTLNEKGKKFPTTWDFREKRCILMPREDGQKLYVQHHGAFGPQPAEGDYVIFKATKPQGSRYRVVKVDWVDVEFAWFAHLEFAPRTEQEIHDDERSV